MKIGIDQFFSFTAENVNERHELLLVTIGTFPEEDDAYWAVTTLSWALPMILVISTILDSILVWVYMKYAHPWKDILVDA